MPEEKEFTNAQLARGIAFLMNEIRGLTENVGGMGQRMEALEKQEPPAAPPPPKEDEEPPKLDEMSNTEMAKWLLGTIKTEMIDPMKEHMQGTETARAEKEAQAAVQAAAGKYADFGQWDAEIAPLIEENPNLSLDDAYLLARTRNPEKAQQIDDAAAKAAEDEQGKEESEDIPFGGLLPTSSISTETTQMTLDDAGEAAWDKTMADFATLIPHGGGGEA
jgi:hypothetical protein